MTSQRPKSLSIEEPEEQNTDSVYDFLYHDSRRVASFLSQFDKFGHLTGLTRGEYAERSKADSGTIEASGGLPSVFSGGGSHTHDAGAATSRESSRTYDPLWTNALTLLDYLDERHLINRDIGNARLGQFVLGAGDLDIRDLRLIQKAMALPSMQAQIAASSAPVQPSFHKSKSKGRQHSPTSTQPAQNQQFGTEFLALLPHSVQVQLHAENFELWCTLNEDGLVVSSSDLFLKHGVRVPGEWHVLGVLDALPSATGDEDPTQVYAEAQSSLPGENFDSIITIATRGMGGLIDGIVPFTRLLLGRRDSQFGITPLLIFRKIRG